MGVSLSGSGQYGDIGASTAVELTDEYLFAGWIKTTTTTRGGIFSALNDGTFVGWLLELNFSTAGKLGAFEDVGEWDESTSNTYNSGSWVHIALLKTGGTLKFYKNGVEDGSFACIANAASGQTKFIGKNHSTDVFTGDVAEFAVWDASLMSGAATTAITSLAGGADPATVESGALVWGCHMTTNTDVADFVGTDDVTWTGSPSTSADHPIGGSTLLLVGRGMDDMRDMR